MDSIFKRIIKKIKNLYCKILMIPLYFKLSRIKPIQKYNFKKLHKQFFLKYNKLKTGENNDFITPHWEFFNKKIAEVLLPAPAFSFLQNQHIRQTMVVNGKNWHKKELAYLEKRVPEAKLKKLLAEEYIGKPDIASS
ncbi:MAG: hypothetical protein ABIG60_04890, partial [Patescibacteria group bacterium]